MKRAYFVLCLLLIFSLDRAGAGIVIKGLKLKYVLIQVAEDVYEANILKPDFYNSNQFKKFGTEGLYYYQWLIDTYNQFPEDKKMSLQRIFDYKNSYQMMKISTLLPDTASLEDIIASLVLSGDFKKIAPDISGFFPYFYSIFLKNYICRVNQGIEENVNTIQNQIDKKDIDVLDFMEKTSGCKFNQKYTLEFYFTLDYLSAASFVHDLVKISTLQRSKKDLNDVLRTVFHEFSHELFRNFSMEREFCRNAKKLGKMEAFKYAWQPYKRNYEWRGWCEENLVNGFAGYLYYKYCGNIRNFNYYYDKKFFEYLRKIDFNPEKGSLEKACNDFMKFVAEEG